MSYSLTRLVVARLSETVGSSDKHPAYCPDFNFDVKMMMICFRPGD